MKILAFETSCDDTSIALFENEKLVSMHTKSQIKLHNKTGGVVPEVASREHANVIFDVLDDVLKEWGVMLQDIDYIAVTTHPGLVPSLLTGITVASTLSQALQIPIIPIDHIEAHIFSNWLERDESEIVFPLVCLTVSGGHNEIWYMQDMWSKEKLGQTQDDAAGEAYDKVAKMMGLEYPGGPIISKLAEEYNKPLSHPSSQRKKGKTIEKKPLFPRVFLEKSEFGFSFSGLKSAVRREIEKRIQLLSNLGSQESRLSIHDVQEISYEFQAAVNEVLAFKLLEAARQKEVQTLLLAGGVSANDDLNEKIHQEVQKLGLKFLAPKKKLYCMDNAAMIGILAYYKVKYLKRAYKIGSVTLGES
ncbi:tRNA (adenosine(37)-N6)-threonylcarbamoyltransferase complex transferase subunit TsaD [Candidatus Gracilibacteria bacterium]|nr:tRNA (adenosine(37)-N6)-threonylcarbamoyltransferase complex transferase subunit TsaD [Candidatus Gracilibacteria bacterium]